MRREKLLAQRAFGLRRAVIYNRRTPSSAWRDIIKPCRETEASACEAWPVCFAALIIAFAGHLRPLAGIGGGRHFAGMYFHLSHAHARAMLLCANNHPHRDSSCRQSGRLIVTSLRHRVSFHRAAPTYIKLWHLMTGDGVAEILLAAACNSSSAQLYGSLSAYSPRRVAAKMNAQITIELFL